LPNKIKKRQKTFAAVSNQDVKTNVIGKKPINKEQMKSNVEDFMMKRKNDRK
jgi:hypothetical protein